MSIILGLIGIILGIGLVVWLISLIVVIVKFLLIALWYILKYAFYLSIPVGAIALFVYLFNVIGLWTLAVIALFSLVSYLIWHFRPEPLESRVIRYFQEFEMASFDDMQKKVEGKTNFDDLRDLVQKLIKKGKLEEIELGGGGSLYRWKESRNYPQGVITTHIILD